MPSGFKSITINSGNQSSSWWNRIPKEKIIQGKDLDGDGKKLRFLVTNGPDDVFWWEEYYKHGTCYRDPVTGHCPLSASECPSRSVAADSGGGFIKPGAKLAVNVIDYTNALGGGMNSRPEHKVLIVPVSFGQRLNNAIKVHMENQSDDGLDATPDITTYLYKVNRTGQSPRLTYDLQLMKNHPLDTYTIDIMQNKLIDLEAVFAPNAPAPTVVSHDTLAVPAVKVNRVETPAPAAAPKPVVKKSEEEEDIFAALFKDDEEISLDLD